MERARMMFLLLLAARLAIPARVLALVNRPHPKRKSRELITGTFMVIRGKRFAYFSIGRLGNVCLIQGTDSRSPPEHGQV